MKKQIDKKGLLNVRKDGNEAAVIFVHGLQGHPYKTWTKKGCESLPDIFTEDESYDDFDIFTFGYSTGFIFKRHEFNEIAELLYTEIEAKLSNYKCLSFITHSMGGIVVQSMIREQVERKNESFIKTISGIVYLAVPFFGSTIASTASLFPYVFLPPIIGERLVSTQVQKLKVFSKELADLSVKWNQYRGEELLELKELNLYGQSDRTVARLSARAPHIKNSKGVEEGHISICKITKDNTVYKLISKFYKDINDESKKEPLIDNEKEIKIYNQWLNMRTINFFIPGARVPLPIEHAWASLQVIDEPNDEASESLEKEIKKYHEWERLSKRRDTNNKNAQDIVELGKRIVLIGGPGSGKSTLARRTVNRLVVKGEKVLYVRLPHVAKEMEQGESFENALWSVALDGYSGNKSLLKKELDEVGVVVADGLDECGFSLKRVIMSLHDWLIGRSETRVVVTTRPVGYNPALFNSFHHVEMLPLKEQEIKTYSLKLLKVLNKDNDGRSVELHNKFQHQLETNKMVNVAARSPLLLNFLIQLLVSGKEVGNYRVDLYDEVINQWILQSERGNEKQLDNQIALRSIEWLGWILQNALEDNGGLSRKDVLGKLTAFVENELSLKPLQARKLANECLQFWVEVGVLEHLRVGYEEGYTFIHLTLGEYAAGKYISNLHEREQKEILLEKMHNPIWRETLLLASGTGCVPLFVETILEYIHERMDVYNDVALAAAMLAEGPPISNLSIKVADKAIESLTSSLPILCYEVGDAMEGIAQQESDWIFSLVEPILDHPQIWTKLVSYKLALLTRKVKVDVNTIHSIIELKPKNSFGSEIFKVSVGLVVWNEVLELSLEYVLRNNTINDKELIEILEDLSAKGFNLRFQMKISKILHETGKADMIKVLNGRLKEGLDKFDFKASALKFQNGERALLTAVLGQISDQKEKVFNKENRLIEISKFYKAILLDEKPIFDLDVIAHGVDSAVISEVIKGVLLVYNFNLEDLYNEIRWVLSGNDESESVLFLNLPDVLEPEPDWDMAKSQLNQDLIIKALSYPAQTIADSGATLLANCFESKDIKQAFIDGFMEAEEKSLLYFGLVARYILEEDTLDVIIERLNGKQSKGIHYLYEVLLDIPQAKDNELVNVVLLDGIKNIEPIVAKKAARTFLILGNNFDKVEVFSLVSYWDKNGVICERDGEIVTGSSCSKCHVVPDSPLPDLLQILKGSNIFTMEDRIYYSKHPRSDVKQAGLETLTYYLSDHLHEVEKIIHEIKMGKESYGLLDAIFNLNTDTLKYFSEKVLSLNESNIVEVRKRLLDEFIKARWTDYKKCVPIIVKALNDENTIVSNQAVITYRSLGLSEEIPIEP